MRLESPGVNRRVSQNRAKLSMAPSHHPPVYQSFLLPCFSMASALSLDWKHVLVYLGMLVASFMFTLSGFSHTLWNVKLHSEFSMFLSRILESPLKYVWISYEFNSTTSHEYNFISHDNSPNISQCLSATTLPSILHSNKHYLENWMPMYGKGVDDIFLLIGWSILLAIFRFLFMKLVTHYYTVLSSNTSSLESASSEHASPTTPRKRGQKLLGHQKNTRVVKKSQPVLEQRPSSSSDATSHTTATPTADDAKRLIESRAGVLGDQLHQFTHYAISFAFGAYIYINSPFYPFWTNSVHMWTDYPVHRLPLLTKCFYLYQISFWLQQLSIFVFFTSLKRRRKDHLIMSIHHLITSLLLIISYVTHFTRCGTVILVLMDTADALLTMAKSFKYMGGKYAVIGDFLFVLFVISWIFTRHFVFFLVLHSVAFESYAVLAQLADDSYFTRVMHTACDLARPGVYVHFINTGCLILLSLLQVLLLFWLFLICKVVFRMVSGRPVEDVREED